MDLEKRGKMSGFQKSASIQRRAVYQSEILKFSNSDVVRQQAEGRVGMGQMAAMGSAGQFGQMSSPMGQTNGQGQWFAFNIPRSPFAFCQGFRH